MASLLKIGKWHLRYISANNGVLTRYPKHGVIGDNFSEAGDCLGIILKFHLMFKDMDDVS